MILTDNWESLFGRLDKIIELLAEEEQSKSFRNKPLTAIFTDRDLVSVLNKHHIMTIGELLQYRRMDLRLLPDVGARGVVIIQDVLKQYKLELRED